MTKLSLQFGNGILLIGCLAAVFIGNHDRAFAIAAMILFVGCALGIIEAIEKAAINLNIKTERTIINNNVVVDDDTK